MRTRLISTVAIAALALAACGGDDDGGGSPQDGVADMMLEVINSELGEDTPGVSIDEQCVRDAIGELSDEDAQKILDAGPDGNPEVSASAEAIGESIFECVEIDLSDVELDG